MASLRPALAAWGHVSKTKYPSHAKKKKVQMHFGFITKDFVQSVPLYTQCSILIRGLHKIQISSGVETADCFKGMGRKAGNAEPSQASLSCLAYRRFSMFQFFSLSFCFIYFTRCRNRWKKWLYMNHSQIPSPLNASCFLPMFLDISYANVL